MCNVTYGKIPGEVDGKSFGGKGVAGFLRFIKENCSAEIFDSVCEEKRQAITPYHEILYDHLCFNSSCKSDQLFCQNMKTIASESYTESLNIVPFCGPVSLGSDAQQFLETRPRLFDIISFTCKLKFSLAVVLGIILTILCITLNIIVILITKNSESFKNAYGSYKISLAIADLLVGIFVAPLFTLTILSRGLMPAIDLNYLRDNFNVSVPSYGFPPVIFSLIGVSGVIMTMSILASVFTLAFSSIDRYFAIRFPFKYRRIIGKSLNNRIYLTIGFSWFLALVISALPFIIENSKYQLTSSLLVVGTGKTFYLIYGASLLLPLLAMWTINFITASHFHSYRAKVKHTLRSTANANTDISMSKTLIVMVGSFTICLLPMITLNFIEVVNYEKLDPLNDFENLDLEFMNSMNTLSILASMFLIANSFMNAVIYSLMSWRFRMEAEEFFYQTILRRKNYKSKLRPSSGGLTMTSTVGEANTSFSVR